MSLDIVLAIDPGRGKCGLAVVTQEGSILHQAVVPSPEIGAAAKALVTQYKITKLVLGDRTAATWIRELLRKSKLGLSPVTVDEHHSSEEGRRRYFQANPPKGWRRLLPVSLQTPPRAYDDYVAIILAERYFRSLVSS